jgi:hypothetical protein
MGSLAMIAVIPRNTLVWDWISSGIMYLSIIPEDPNLYQGETP